MASEVKPFPIDVKPAGKEEVRVSFPGGSFLLCAHGAKALARDLLKAVDGQYCDGYRHGDESSMWLGFVPEHDDDILESGTIFQDLRQGYHWRRVKVLHNHSGAGKVRCTVIVRNGEPLGKVLALNKESLLNQKRYQRMP